MVGAPSPRATEPDVGKECARTTNIARLADLPPGLIAANIDLGPHIVAMTPHRVVAAPYHRLDKGILADHAILHGTPEEAERTARSLGVNYIALCGATNGAGAKPASGGEIPELAAGPPDARRAYRLPAGDRAGARQADPRLARAAGGLIRLGWQLSPASAT